MTSVRNNAVSTALLLGWVIFGCLNCSVLAEPQKSSEKSSQDNQDLGDYDEASPENIKVPAKAEPTLMPYFDEEKKTVYAKQDSEVILNCPAKNYNESHHVLMWFKNNNTITTGRVVLVNTTLYQLDKDMNLIVNKVSEKTKGDYYCAVMPQNVRINVVLEIGEEPEADNGGRMMVTASAFCLVVSLLARELSFGIVSLATKGNFRVRRIDEYAYRYKNRFSLLLLMHQRTIEAAALPNPRILLIDERSYYSSNGRLLI